MKVSLAVVAKDDDTKPITRLGVFAMPVSTPLHACPSLKSRKWVEPNAPVLDLSADQTYVIEERFIEVLLPLHNYCHALANATIQEVESSRNLNWAKKREIDIEQREKSWNETSLASPD